MNTKQKTIVACGAIAAIIILSIAGILLTSQQKTNTISLGITDFPGSALIYIAQEKGFFKEEGLNVEMSRFPTGKATFDSMLANGVELSTVADFPLALATLSNQEFFVIATMGQGENAKLVARKDRGINSPQDLKGKKIATKKGGTGELFLHKFFAQEKIPVDSVEFVFMEPQDMILALERSDIDAFAVWEPFISNAKKELGENAIIFRTPKEKYIETWNLATRQSVIEQKPEEISRFLKALLKAEDFFNSNKEESTRIIQKYSGGISEEALNEFFSGFEMGLKLDPALIRQVEDAEQWAISQKIVKNTEKKDFSKMVKTDFLKTIKPDRVTLDINQ